MKTDAELRDDVLAEIEWEPSVEGGEIGVTAHSGVVTLTGRVKNFFEKTEAMQAARRVAGVTAIADELDVPWDLKEGPTDTDIAESARRALSANVSAMADQVQVIVEEGRVRLEGEVKWQFQRVAAERTVASVRGVRSVTNALRIAAQPANTGQIKAKIENAFKRRADLDASRITVRSDEYTVILEGSVPAVYERDAAERAAWSAAGVRVVDNRIRVNPALAPAETARA